MNFEVGDRVWSFSRQEWGKVIQLDGGDLYYSVRVQFEEEDAKWCNAGDLFFEEIVIPESARVRPTPKHEFKPGDPVCVRQSNTWYISTFESQRADDGKFICRVSNFPSGTSTWRECRPYDRTLLGFDAVEEKNDE